MTSYSSALRCPRDKRVEASARRGTRGAIHNQRRPVVQPASQPASQQFVTGFLREDTRSRFDLRRIINRTSWPACLANVDSTTRDPRRDVTLPLGGLKVCRNAFLSLSLRYRALGAFDRDREGKEKFHVPFRSRGFAFSLAISRFSRFHVPRENERNFKGALSHSSLDRRDKIWRIKLATINE